MARLVNVKILRSTKDKLEDFSTYPLNFGELGFATDSHDLYIGAGIFNRNLSKRMNIDDVLTNENGEILVNQDGNILMKE